MSAGKACLMDGVARKQCCTGAASYLSLWGQGNCDSILMTEAALPGCSFDQGCTLEH